jgi:hypothetical protein
MGQQEIMDFLRLNSRGWFTSRQICEAVNVSLNSVTTCMGRLKRFDEVKVKPVMVVFNSPYGTIRRHVEHFSYKR